MSEPKVRRCDQEGCQLPALFYCVWTKSQYYCFIHMQRVLNVADAMGFPTPAATMRNLEINEMVVRDEDSQP